MIIIQQTQGSSLSDLVVDEVAFQTETGATDVEFFTFEYDGNDWWKTLPVPSAMINIADYGISFTGTPANTDIISVGYSPSDLNVFQAGKGINAVKINANFAEVQQHTNDNESNITAIANTALLKDGSNLTQTIIDDFQQQTPIILATTSGSITLTDNRVHFLELTGNGEIILPTVNADQYSHTIVLVVQGGSYSLDIARDTAGTFASQFNVDIELPYNVIYMYNKIDQHWYYSLSQ